MGKEIRRNGSKEGVWKWAFSMGVAVEVLWGRRNKGKGGREKKKNGAVRVGVVSLEVGGVVEWLCSWKKGASRRNDSRER